MAFPPPGGWTPAPDALRDGPGYRTSRFHRKRDLGKPVRPVTAYDIFFRNTYPWLKNRRPDLTQQQMFSEIGRMWRETTSWEDRQVCYDYSDWEKDRYDREMKAWRSKRKMQKQRDREKASGKKLDLEGGADVFQGFGRDGGRPDKKKCQLL